MRKGACRVGHVIVYHGVMKDGWIDRAALGLSGLCVLHCLAGLLLVVVLAAGSDLAGHSVHAIGLSVALPLAAFALWRGLRLHRQPAVLVLGVAGLALMALSLALGHGGLAEVAVSVAGVTLLAAAHLLNLRWSAAAR